MAYILVHQRCFADTAVTENDNLSIEIGFVRNYPFGRSGLIASKFSAYLPSGAPFSSRPCCSELASSEAWLPCAGYL